MLESRPVVLRQMAKDWDAVKEWDLDVLDQKCGHTTAMLSSVFRKDDTIAWNRA